MLSFVSVELATISSKLNMMLMLMVVLFEPSKYITESNRVLDPASKGLDENAVKVKSVIFT